MKIKRSKKEKLIKLFVKSIKADIALHNALHPEAKIAIGEVIAKLYINKV